MIEVSRVLNSATNLNTLLTSIIDEAAYLIDAETASILLLDPYTRELHFKATSAGSDPEIIDMPVPLNGSIAGTVLKSNQPLVVNEVSDDPRWNPNIAQSINFQTGSILCVPMNDEHKPVGVLQAINKRMGSFSDEDVATLAILADLAGVAVEKARLIDELKKANKQLNELDRLKSDFIALASHELRTPISIILGYVSFLRDDADEDMAENLDSVLRAAIKLRTLIEDMVNLQYVDAGESALNLKLTDWVEMVRELTLERDETAEAKEIQLDLILPDKPQMVCIDEGMVEAALRNLINNAIKYTPQQGNIRIAMQTRGDEVWCAVRDTGIGIEEGELERIFSRFYQSEPHLRRQYEGMGLGLAIAKELIELHGGRVWAKSKLEAGSEFFIALPLVKE
jgi:signal transduction histidine kinase